MTYVNTAVYRTDHCAGAAFDSERNFPLIFCGCVGKIAGWTNRRSPKSGAGKAFVDSRQAMLQRGNLPWDTCLSHQKGGAEDSRAARLHCSALFGEAACHAFHHAVTADQLMPEGAGNMDHDQDRQHGKRGFVKSDHELFGPAAKPRGRVGIGDP